MSTCAERKTPATAVAELSLVPGDNWSGTRRAVLPLNPQVREYLEGRNNLRTALGQWETALHQAFGDEGMRTHVELSYDPESNSPEITLVVSVDRPGSEARLVLDRVIDAGLPDEAESLFDEVTIVMIGS